VQKPERSIAPGERLKAFTEDKVSNITWQTIPNVNHTLDRIATLIIRLTVVAYIDTFITRN